MKSFFILLVISLIGNIAMAAGAADLFEANIVAGQTFSLHPDPNDRGPLGMKAQNGLMVIYCLDRSNAQFQTEIENALVVIDAQESLWMPPVILISGTSMITTSFFPEETGGKKFVKVSCN